jgi:NAD+ kinase
MTSSERSILFVVNPKRPDARVAAEELADFFLKSGFTLYANPEAELSQIADFDPQHLETVEIAIVLGGDGTMLRAAEAVRGTKIPILGVNLGRVGFLAEVEKPSISEICTAVLEKNYIVDERLVLGYSVFRSENEVSQGWALNEVAVERNETTMVELFVQIDHRPLSRWGCDGLICSTPTGSTAYAFSAGGPVVWPQVDALIVVPISAHALFSKPLVVSAQSTVVIDVESEGALLSADSRRKFPLLQGDRVVMVCDTEKVRLAHLKEILFTDRLVAKFKLPIEGWRGE